MSSSSSLLKTLLLIALALSTCSAYTYLVFEIEWPGTICKQKNCIDADTGNYDGKNFSIHGLWPSGSDANECDYPSNCTNDELDYTQVNQSDLDYINIYWDGFYSDTQSFRVHEWEKHGTCFDGNQNSYYSAVTTLHQKYNPLSSLAKRNIYPNNKKTYSVSYVKQAIEADFQGPALLKCVYVKGVQMLQSIDLFLSTDMTTLLDAPCSKSLNSQCNASKPLVIPEY